MGHVAVFCDDLEALDGFGVADDIVEVDGTVLFYPICSSPLAIGIPTIVGWLLTKGVRSLVHRRH